MNDIIKVLKCMEDFSSLKKVSIEDIIDAETLLGVTFADDYRQYVQECGIAIAYGHEFTGVVDSPRLNVVDVTLKMRKKMKNIPNNVYVIEELGIDDIVIFQNSNGEVYESLPGNKFDKIANSFSEYLKNL